jgi:hypothetical protein
VTYVAKHQSHRSPPRTFNVRSLAPSQLWSLLTDEQRQRTLVTLTDVVLRQLDAPHNVKEVRDELS